jgi:hypothetical protein
VIRSCADYSCLKNRIFILTPMHRTVVYIPPPYFHLLYLLRKITSPNNFLGAGNSARDPQFSVNALSFEHQIRPPQWLRKLPSTLKGLRILSLSAFAFDAKVEAERIPPRRKSSVCQRINPLTFEFTPNLVHNPSPVRKGFTSALSAQYSCCR